MQRDPRLFEDLARVAGGALGALGGVREQVEAQLRAPLERMVRQLDLVPREEFEAVQIMAARARDEQERLTARVETLERQIAALLGQQAAAGAPGLADPAVSQGGAFSSSGGRPRRQPRARPLPPDQE